MGMAGFRRDRGYKQQNPIQGLSALTKLLGMQGDAIQQVGTSVENQGQASARGDVSELMGTDDYKNATPEQAQALVQAGTGGRRLGKEGEATLSNSYGMKGDAQKNDWDVEAERIAEQGRNNRNTTNEAGRNTRASTRNALMGKPVEGNGNMTEELMGIQEQSLRIQKDLDNPNLDAEYKAERRAEQQALQITAEQLISGGKPSAGGQLNLMKNLFPEAPGSKTPKKVRGQKGYVYEPGMNPEVENYLNSNYGRNRGFDWKKNKAGRKIYMDSTGQAITPAWIASHKAKLKG